MINDDRSHTISWDAGEVQRRLDAQRAAAPQPQIRQEQPRPEQIRQEPVRQAAAPQQDPAAAEPAKKKKHKKKKKRMSPLLKLVIWVAFVAVSSVAAASIGWMLANDFAALNKGVRTEVEFQVPESWVSEVTQETDEDGETREVTHYDMEKVAAALKEKGLIQYDWFFRLFCKFYHADTKIEQGTYKLHTEMDYMALVRAMRPTAAQSTAETVDVVIPEGYSVARIIDLLAENGVGTVEDLTETAANYVFEDYDFVDNENLGDPSRLEGFLFPDTYNFYVGGRPQRVFDSMLSNFKKKVYDNDDLTDLFAAMEERGYSLRDIITVASLIEKETDGSDRDRIASVIYNRLEHDGETHYLLQVDAALVYAAGREITQTDYDTLDSPYNLYQHTGLPPTPICNPGLTSIGAALSPADTDYYFYVLGADGKHIFIETLAGHNQTLAQLASQ